MNRAKFQVVIAHALLCVSTASAAEGLMASSLTTAGPKSSQAFHLQSTALAPQHSTALVQSFGTPHTPIAEFIKSPNRVASSINLATPSRSSEIASLIHPLSNPTQPTLDASFAFSRSTVSSLSAARSPEIVTPVTFDPGRDLLQEIVAASGSNAAALQIR